MPVDGPVRCTSTLTSGRSAEYARRLNSFTRALRGPAVGVNARAPAHEAPTTLPSAASSSSACRIAIFFLFGSGSRRNFIQNALRASIPDVAGVIVYQAPPVAPA